MHVWAPSPHYNHKHTKSCVDINKGPVKGQLEVTEELTLRKTYIDSYDQGCMMHCFNIAIAMCTTDVHVKAFYLFFLRRRQLSFCFLKASEVVSTRLLSLRPSTQSHTFHVVQMLFRVHARTHTQSHNRRCRGKTTTLFAPSHHHRTI